MATNTSQIAVSVGTAAQTVVPQDVTGKRLTVWIQSYNITDWPGNVTMYIAFGKAATAGTAGEWELTAGGIYSWGASQSFDRFSLPLSATAPKEYISIIAKSTGPAVGSIMIQTR